MMAVTMPMIARGLKPSLLVARGTAGGALGTMVDVGGPDVILMADTGSRACSIVVCVVCSPFLLCC